MADLKGEHALVEVTEEILRQSKDLRETVDSKFKTAAEKQEEFERKFADLDKKIEAGARANLPQMEVTSLRMDRTQEGFQRLLESRPVGSGAEVGLVEDLQRAGDDVFTLQLLMGHSEDKPASLASLKGTRTFKRFAELRGKLARALDAATTGEGLEWIPTGFSAQIKAKMAVALRAAGLVPTIPLPTNPWIFPFETALPTVEKVSEQATAIANPWDLSSATEMYAAGTPTGATTFTLKKHRAIQVYSREFAEDSVAGVLPWLQGKVGYALGRGRERTFLNGATGTHIDNDLAGGAASIPEKTLNGIRKRLITTLSSATCVAGGGSTSPTVSMYHNVRALMGEFGYDLGNLVWICSPLGYMHMMNNGQVQTLEKYGQGASLVNGEMGRLGGIPIVVSGVAKDNLHTTGVNASGQSNNTTSILLLNTANWAWGEKPGMGVESVRLPFVDQSVLVMFDRFDLQYVGASTDKSVGAIINVPATLAAAAA